MSPTKKTVTSSEKKALQTIKKQNRSLMRSAIDIAKKTNSHHIFFNCDVFDTSIMPSPLPKDIQFFAVSQREDFGALTKKTAVKKINLPNMTLSRMSMIKISVLLALSNKSFKTNDRIVFVTGSPHLNVLDTIMVFHVGNEPEIFSGHNVSKIPTDIKPSVFEQALNLCIEMATKGREGKPIGTTLVIGDEKKVLQLSKQMIINPFKGYKPSERNILSDGLRETMREFAALDGAFIIAGDGEVLTAGCYLSAALEGADLPSGLGSRHIAAAGITSLTNAMAIVISESSGHIRIFRNGSMITEIDIQKA